MSDYSHFVESLKKPGQCIIASLTPEKADLWHMVTLLSGESGELLDAVKKSVIYGKPLDMANVIEELGDIEFALQGIRNSLKIRREDVLDANVTKLSKRYASGGYTDAQARDRADKS